MANLLVLPELGQGPDIWGPVWGHLTAPRQHPPNLVLAPAVGSVTTVDFHAAFGPYPRVKLDDAIDHVANQAQSLGPGPRIAVGHGLSAAILLASLPKWDPAPARVVLFAGATPRRRAPIRSLLPISVRWPLRLLSTLHRLMRRRLSIPQRLVFRRLCNGMDTMEVVHYVAAFRSPPLRWMNARLNVAPGVAADSLVYVALERDLLLTPRLQRDQARLLGAREVVSLDACHQAMLQRPAEVADIIRKAALEV